MSRPSRPCRNCNGVVWPTYPGKLCPWCGQSMDVLVTKHPKAKKRKATEPKLRHPIRHKDEWHDFLRSDGGDPFGHGMPSTSDRWDGESHREAYKRILRYDVCSYCDLPFSGTVDHIIPSSQAAPGDHAHAWINYTGACQNCNGSKSDTPLLLWLARRGVLRRQAA